tara:strand:- start:212 stop:415 length:204 start_codon:yes stop_codon:yes gene_type:complete
MNHISVERLPEPVSGIIRVIQDYHLRDALFCSGFRGINLEVISKPYFKTLISESRKKCLFYSFTRRT